MSDTIWCASREEQLQVRGEEEILAKGQAEIIAAEESLDARISRTFAHFLQRTVNITGFHEDEVAHLNSPEKRRAVFVAHVRRLMAFRRKSYLATEAETLD